MHENSGIAFSGENASNKKLPAGTGGGTVGKARQLSIAQRAEQSGGESKLPLCR
jgi:hypothetical protein